jgi:hypothetical protein
MTAEPGYGGAGVGRAQMRASTVDRDRAVELITRAYTEGRLSKEEHDARVERAMTAGTFADLDSVVIDLPGGGPPPPPAPLKTNTLAIISLSCGIGQLIGGIFAAVPAIICGHLARGQIRQTGETGAGMALTGLILGYVGVALTVILIVAVVVLFIAFAHSVPATSP